MPKSMRMSRLEYSLCKVRNTDSIENRIKNDLSNAWFLSKKRFAKFKRGSKKRSDKKRVTKIAVVTKNDFGVGSARWPDGPPQSGIGHGFGLIPVSGFGDAVDEEKTSK